MKKFISFVPMQRGTTLLNEKYFAPDNPRLEMERKTHFPVIAMINGYAKKGEKFMLIAVMEKGNNDCLTNLEIMKKEIADVIPNTEFETVEVSISKEENIEAHIKTMEMLVDSISDNDELYACITFGTKPTPIIEMTAFNIVNKLKHNVSIECIAYGKINRAYNKDTDKYEICSAYIYDVTALFYMNSIADSLNVGNISNPIEKIKNIIDYKGL